MKMLVKSTILLAVVAGAFAITTLNGKPVECDPETEITVLLPNNGFECSAKPAPVTTSAPRSITKRQIADDQMAADAKAQDADTDVVDGLVTDDKTVNVTDVEPTRRRRATAEVQRIKLAEGAELILNLPKDATVDDITPKDIDTVTDAPAEVCEHRFEGVSLSACQPLMIERLQTALGSVTKLTVGKKALEHLSNADKKIIKRETGIDAEEVPIADDCTMSLMSIDMECATVEIETEEADDGTDMTFVVVESSDVETGEDSSRIAEVTTDEGNHVMIDTVPVGDLATVDGDAPIVRRRRDTSTVDVAAPQVNETVTAEVVQPVTTELPARRRRNSEGDDAAAPKVNETVTAEVDQPVTTELPARRRRNSEGDDGAAPKVNETVTAEVVQPVTTELPARRRRNSEGDDAAAPKVNETVTAEVVQPVTTELPARRRRNSEGDDAAAPKVNDKTVTMKTSEQAPIRRRRQSAPDTKDEAVITVTSKSGDPQCVYEFEGVSLSACMPLVIHRLQTSFGTVTRISVGKEAIAAAARTVQKETKPVKEKPAEEERVLVKRDTMSSSEQAAEMDIIHDDQEVEMLEGRTVSRTMSLDDPEVEDMCLFTVMGVEMECDDDTTIDITTDDSAEDTKVEVTTNEMVDGSEPTLLTDTVDSNGKHVVVVLVPTNNRTVREVVEQDVEEPSETSDQTSETPEETTETSLAPRETTIETTSKSTIINPEVDPLPPNVVRKRRLSGPTPPRPENLANPIKQIFRPRPFINLEQLPEGGLNGTIAAPKDDNIRNRRSDAESPPSDDQETVDQQSEDESADEVDSDAVRVPRRFFARRSVKETSPSSVDDKSVNGDNDADAQ